MSGMIRTLFLFLAISHVAWGSFTDLGTSLGVNPVAAVGKLSAIDFDFDGDTDLFGYYVNDQPFYWVNNGGSFSEASGQLSFETAIRNYRFADFDQDGDLDMIALDSNGYLTLLINEYNEFTMQAYSLT